MESEMRTMRRRHGIYETRRGLCESSACGRRAAQSNKLRRTKRAVDSHGVLLPREKGCFTGSSAALVIYLTSQKLFMIPFVLFSTVCECFKESIGFQNKSHWYTTQLSLALSHASAGRSLLPVVNRSLRGNQGGDANGMKQAKQAGAD